ncbi:MAG: lysoplasmalogenase [Alphaproteobacteria bacterium]|nr:lysoplasmalogenase [Alphaproteobacteria bacterium]
MTAILYISIAISVVYGAFWCHRPTSLVRAAAKTSTIALLALWAHLEGGNFLLVAALALSSVGDAFLAADDEDRFLLPGMAAFFAAHVAYVVLFWATGAWETPPLILALQVILTLGGAAFLFYIVPWVDKMMRLPVIAYTIIILLMGNGALRMQPQFWIASVGAIAFIASDVILSFNLFRLDKSAPIRAVTSRAVWILYYGGQLMIAWSFLHEALAD